MKKPALIMLAITAPLLSACSSGPNEAAGYRHSIFHVIAWHFGTLGAMAKGEQPFDQAVFERKAGILEELSTLPWEGFQEGTAEGSDAKPAIWENRDDFDAKARDFEERASTLASLAREGDQQAMLDQVGKVGQACKACHDDYRK
ncbi:c-type cytochrome [Alloalcanivorax sp. C16-2]|uniref:c-type cytochrome n=1 Tax=Alloalcanivorax TaxID=3020832 RepID=UPI0019335782|nr:cytochrome c [Alloalcanivorax marinus]MBL7250605.1 cytochrome c [Alloalcanivorax marinus]